MAIRTLPALALPGRFRFLFFEAEREVLNQSSELHEGCGARLGSVY